MLKKLIMFSAYILIFLLFLYTIICIIYTSQTKENFTLNTQNIESKLDNILEDRVDNKNIFGASVRIESGDDYFSWSKTTGNCNEDQVYVAASITKMYTTSVILRLVDEGKLSLNDKISKHLTSDIIEKLHIYKNTDYSNELTVKNLLFQTSGLPDYFEEKSPTGTSIMKEVMENGDVDSSVKEAITITKTLKAHFQPGKDNSAYYSDINFDLLGLIIEEITNASLEESYKKYIFIPLNLKDTFLMTKDKINSETLGKMIPVNLGSENVIAPLYLSSYPASGGIISNSQEQMIFLKAFFQGKLFSNTHIKDISQFNKLKNMSMSSLDYGGGIMRSKLIKPVAIFYPNCTIIGHSGASGSFAFYCPEKDLYITGTLNQMKNPSYPYPFMMKLLNCF